MLAWSQLGHKLWSDKKWGVVGVRNRLRSSSWVWWLAAGCQQDCLCSVDIDLFSSPDGCECFWKGRYELHLKRIIIKSVFVCDYILSICFITDVHHIFWYSLVIINLRPSFDPQGLPDITILEPALCMSQLHPHGSHCNKPRYNKNLVITYIWILNCESIKQLLSLFTCENWFTEIA